jgi:anaerobic magnesium-protoporphyrin IX monomethyl ester cyclase
MYNKIKYLKDMNCQSISVGVETGNENMRVDFLNKKATNDIIVKAFHTINSFGIRTVSFILIGFPFETKEFIFETIDLIREAKVASPNVGFVYPFKGCRLRYIVVNKGLFDPSIEINGAPQYSRNFPAIKNPNISIEEYMGIYRTFMFFCKFPRERFSDIQIAQQLDDRGNEMYSKLKNEYVDKMLFNRVVGDN